MEDMDPINQSGIPNIMARDIVDHDNADPEIADPDSDVIRDLNAQGAQAPDFEAQLADVERHFNDSSNARV